MTAQSGSRGDLSPSPHTTQHALRHEVAVVPRECESTRNCRKDEGRSFDVVLQEKISNHLKRLWSKAMVVSVKEKALLKCQVWIKKVNDE